MATDLVGESAIFERVITPESPKLPEEAARYFLSIGFGAEDKERLRDLASKARNGTLTPAEEDEIGSYERVGHFLAILQSKARQSLRHMDTESP